MLVMNKNLVQQSKALVRGPIGTETNIEEIPKKSAEASTLSSYFQVKSEDESNKCKQWGCESFETGYLRKLFKAYNREKSNKLNRCDFASLFASALRIHLKIHSGRTKQMLPM